MTKTFGAVLNAAKKLRNDEFYTRLPYIKNEMAHYIEHFRGASVLCNCDDPDKSQFVRYFVENFGRLGLRRLVATCHRDQSRDLLSGPRPERAAKLEVGPGGRSSSFLEGDGDFRSPEVVELLRDADIVVTNPPFSLFREYVAQLMEHGKQFLVLGLKNALAAHETFSLIRDNRMWMGVTPRGGEMLFDIPPAHVAGLVAAKKEGSAYRIVDGKVARRFGNATWYTNLDHAERRKRIELTRRYDPRDYPPYVNYPAAIEVGKVADIPRGHDGEMGVPVTFLDRYNPAQFEIVGSSQFLARPMNDVLGRRMPGPGTQRFHLDNGDGTYRRLYERIVIRSLEPGQ